MMFSMEKCSGRNGSGTSEESEMNGGGGLVKEGVPSDVVYSAVAAVSDEIGDILKDELGDADRADRIGAELADLSAELGLLAGLADGEPQPDIPSLFEFAMAHRSTGTGSSSSSWSGRRHSGRPRAPPRRRPIAKGKEASRRRSAMARRAALRARRGPPSDASDVGADSDSDDQWTELDDASGLSDTSSGKEASGVGDMDCSDYHKEPAEAPALGQFLLPLLSAGPAPPDPDHFLIRHEDILQLLASAEESVRDELPLEDDEAALDSQPDMLPNSDMFICEEAAVTPEEEAALLHYVCEAERVACESGVAVEADAGRFRPVEEWLLGVYRSWCEISALMYTLIGTEMSVETVRSEWWYRASFGCHCRLCLCLADNAAALHAFLRALVWALAHGEHVRRTQDAGRRSVQTVRSEWWYRASFGCHCRLCLCLADNAAALHAFLRALVWALAHGEHVRRTQDAGRRSVQTVRSEWWYRASFGCHCRLCLCLADNAAALHAFLRALVWALAHGEHVRRTQDAGRRSVQTVRSEWWYRASFGCHCRLCLCLADNAAALHAFLRALVWALAHGEHVRRTQDAGRRSVQTVRSEWWYRASFGCHCRLCLCLADNAAALHAFLRALVWALAHGGNTSAAAGVMRALRLRAGSASRVSEWDLPRLQRLNFGEDGAAIIHEQLNRLSQQSDIAGQIVHKICQCREHERPFEKEYAVERLCKILENFKAASTITFKVEMLCRESKEGGEWVSRARRRLARFLAPHQRASTSARLRDMAARTTPQDLTAWSGYKHRCDCLNPRTLCAQQRKQLLSDVYYRISFFGMMQAVNEFNSGKMETAGDKSLSDGEHETSGRELQQGDGTGAKPPDTEGQPTSLVKIGAERDLSDSNGDLDDLSASESSGSTSGSGSDAEGVSAGVGGAGDGAGGGGGGGLCGAVRRLVRSIAAIERLMDRVLRHCAACPPPPASPDHDHRSPTLTHLT
ncbi:unnamed protein product [Parnassius mnemosyne]|uniref:Uncharacterized protein n=1 Tax=Parnassius mnemosyne TaxID=213953 RepID=A0AAV1LCP5_9NEOP